MNIAALGIPSEAHYLASYLMRTGRSAAVPARDWNYYLVFNMFRLVGILQGIAKRAQLGNASNASAVLAVKHETDPEAIRRNFTVLQDDAGRVRRVIEKPRHPPMRIGTGGTG